MVVGCLMVIIDALFHICTNSHVNFKVAQFLLHWIFNGHIIKSPMTPLDIPKTAVIAPFGLFEFCVLTFGLGNAAQIFQRNMDSALRELGFVYVYADYVLITSDSCDDMKTTSTSCLRDYRCMD